MTVAEDRKVKSVSWQEDERKAQPKHSEKARLSERGVRGCSQHRDMQPTYLHPCKQRRCTGGASKWRIICCCVRAAPHQSGAHTMRAHNLAAQSRRAEISSFTLVPRGSLTDVVIASFAALRCADVSCCFLFLLSWCCCCCCCWCWYFCFLLFAAPGAAAAGCAPWCTGAANSGQKLVVKKLVVSAALGGGLLAAHYGSLRRLAVH